MVSAGPDDVRDQGSDFAFGDNAIVLLAADGNIRHVETVAYDIGGNDLLLGGGGNDLLIGGFGEDDIRSGAADDFVFGDNAYANFDSRSNFINGASLAPTLGGKDSISGGDGIDRIVGGTSTDSILVGPDHDIVFGDHAGFDLVNLPIDQNFFAMFTGSQHGGALDYVRGQEGDDFIFGGQSGDLLFGDAGDDDIIGGHNVRFGSDGDDYIEGGDQADVILGDNGMITRSLLPSAVEQWERYPAPFADVIRHTIQRFDDIDRIIGHDTIIGDNATPGPNDGDDIIHGQRGNDELHGRGGDDEITGELGDDTITGGDGHDTILGDVGKIDREFIDANTPRVDRNGKWHRDIVLEDVAQLTGIYSTEQTPLGVDPTVANTLLTSDLLILTGSHNVDGIQSPECG